VNDKNPKLKDVYVMNEQIDPRIYEKRWDRIIKELEKNEKDAFIVSNPGNVRYLSCAHIPSFPLLNHIVVERDGKVTGITSSLEKFRALEEAHVDELLIFTTYPGIHSDGKTPIGTLKKLIKEKGWKNALIDNPVNTRLVKKDTSGLITKMRMRKDPLELKFIQTAAEITDRGAEELPELIDPGLSERQIAKELNHILRDDERVQTEAFETIIASGTKSAFSHHDVTDRKIEKGDVVICDFGVYVNGYCSDCTRTFFAGNPSDEMTDIYELVLEGQELGIESAVKGKTYGSIDENIRDLFKQTDHHKYFVHSTGHGIGLEVHEAPNGIRIGMKTKIEEDHIFTVEPGIYIPGQGGVRIEDDILIKDGKPVSLTKSPKTL